MTRFSIFLSLTRKRGRCVSPPFIGARDTLELARAKLPGRQHSLDALCDHFGVSRRSREKHGALRDAKLLAEVYLRLSRRRQA
ncbi:MAG: exonuclease domain-containing protein [Rhodomicrobium sp.]